jgi:uncharacterized protein
MACRYCQEAATQPTRAPMPPGTLEAAWRFLLPNGLPERSSVSIHLGSGEPLLNLPLLKKIAALEKNTHAGQYGETGGTIRVFITTNATLLTPGIMDWLVDVGWYVKISLDGPEVIQDRWRVLPGGKGTYDQAARCVAYLVERIPDRLSVPAVLCRGTDAAEAFEGIAKLGARRIDLVPAVTDDESIKLSPEDLGRYREFVMNYAKSLLETDHPDAIPIYAKFHQYVVRVMGYQLGRVCCGAGRTYAAISAEGDIFSCARFIGMDRYKIGNVTTGLDPGAAGAFLDGPGRSYEYREPCRECWAAPICTGPCFSFVEMFGQCSGNPLDFHCDFMLATAEAAVYLVHQLREHNPERLLAFLPLAKDISDWIG